MEKFNLYRPLMSDFHLEYERPLNEAEIASLESAECVKGDLGLHIRCKVKDGSCKYLQLSSEFMAPEVGAVIDPSKIILRFLKNSEDQFIVRATVI